MNPAESKLRSAAAARQAKSRAGALAEGISRHAFYCGAGDRDRLVAFAKLELGHDLTLGGIRKMRERGTHNDTRKGVKKSPCNRNRSVQGRVVVSPAVEPQPLTKKSAALIRGQAKPDPSGANQFDFEFLEKIEANENPQPQELSHG